MNTKTDEGSTKARKLFISRRASTNSPAEPARPVPITACSTRNWRTGNARSTTGSCRPVPRRQGLGSYDFTSIRLPDGYMLMRLLGLGFIPRAQDTVFYGKTGRGKTHLAIPGWA